MITTLSLISISFKLIYISFTIMNKLFVHNNTVLIQLKLFVFSDVNHVKDSRKYNLCSYLTLTILLALRSTISSNPIAKISIGLSRSASWDTVPVNIEKKNMTIWWSKKIRVYLYVCILEIMCLSILRKKGNAVGNIIWLQHVDKCILKASIWLDILNCWPQ